MHESFDKPEQPREGKDYHDSRFHDDDEDVAVDDLTPRKTGLPARRKPTKKLPPRHYDYDD